MTKVTVECSWTEECGDKWPPQFCMVRRDVEFDVTCLCGGTEFGVKSHLPAAMAGDGKANRAV